MSSNGIYSVAAEKITSGEGVSFCTLDFEFSEVLAPKPQALKAPLARAAAQILIKVLRETFGS